ncbi:MAG: hypothetical protein AAB409_00745 [Gemmatimonadota bacterium]
MSQELWAKIVALGVQHLRRGSWYRVVDESKPETVSVDVNGAAVEVPRSCVALAADRPLAWSVVREDPPNPYFGAVYGVCPDCLERARLAGSEKDLLCPACGLNFPVNWSGAR